MRAASMCFSVLQVPRCRIYSVLNVCRETFDSRIWAGGFTPRLLGPSICGLEGGRSKRWSRRQTSTKAEWMKESTLSSSSNISNGISDERASTEVNINKTATEGFQRIQYSDIVGQIADNNDLASLVTFFVFDIETTGFRSERSRIIEIAIRDLQGGPNSTFQTLINPCCHVPNSNIHGITSKMVSGPGVPRMEELIPILLAYIRSRQKPGGFSVFVAHNGRSFDVPFLMDEFSRCSYEIPREWKFLDTLPLGREAIKSRGTKLPSSASLEALREHYGIKLVGSAHRALSDVHTLSLVFQRLTFDLELNTLGLLERCFRASDIISSKKKKNSS